MLCTYNTNTYHNMAAAAKIISTQKQTYLYLSINMFRFKIHSRARSIKRTNIMCDLFVFFFLLGLKNNKNI